MSTVEDPDGPVSLDTPGTGLVGGVVRTVAAGVGAAIGLGVDTTLGVTTHIWNRIWASPETDAEDAARDKGTNAAGSTSRVELRALHRRQSHADRNSRRRSTRDIEGMPVADAVPVPPEIVRVEIVDEEETTSRPAEAAIPDEGDRKKLQLDALGNTIVLVVFCVGYLACIVCAFVELKKTTYTHDAYSVESTFTVLLVVCIVHWCNFWCFNFPKLLKDEEDPSRCSQCLFSFLWLVIVTLSSVCIHILTHEGSVSDQTSPELKVVVMTTCTGLLILYVGTGALAVVIGLVYLIALYEALWLLDTMCASCCPDRHAFRSLLW